MAEQRAPVQLVRRSARIGAGDEPAEPADIVIAQKGRQCARRRRPAFIERIAEEQPRQPRGRPAFRHGFGNRGLEREIEHRRQAIDAGVARAAPRIDLAKRDLAENVEVRNAARCRACAHRRHERGPEFGVHMLSGVDAKAVDPEPVDPAAVNLDHPGDDARMLGHQIVETGKIAHGRAFALKGRVAAIVIEARIVEPAGLLHPLLARRHIGGIGVAGIGQPGEVFGSADMIAGKARIDRRAGQPAFCLIGIIGARPIGAGRAFAVQDHIGRVVGDDVHIDLDAAPVRGVDQRAKLCLGAEMRIDGGEIGHPIAVIAGALAPLGPLHRLVAEHRSQPDRRRAQPLNIIEPRRQPAQIAALKKALVRRIEARDLARAGQATPVIAGIAIFEPVGKQEIDQLVFGRAGAQPGERIGVRRPRAGAEQRQRRDQGPERLHAAAAPAVAAQVAAMKAA